MNGLRLGTPECVRWGMDCAEMRQLAECITDALTSRRSLADVGARVSALKAGFNRLRYVRDGGG
jgi:glycine hydroxymethyltransferase